MTQTAAKPKPPSTRAPASGRKRPPKAFAFHYSRWGLLGALLFFSASLVPSLMPRTGVAQGIISGITSVIGYGFATGFVALWHYLGGHVPQGTARRWILSVVTLALAALLGLSVWKFVGWQNDVREIFGVEPLSPTIWPTILIVGAIIAYLLLALARGLRALFRWAGDKFSAWLPRRLAVTLSTTVTLLVIWGLLSGAIVDGFFAVSNRMFSTRDSGDKPLVVEPTSALKSGSPASLVKWDELGRQGRDFISRTTTVEQINEVTGGGALEPIRVYVGLKSADTVQGRADLLLEELKRTGAFDRKAILLCATTGTGWLDPNAMDPVEFMFNGDSAIAGVQYSYLPSWISLFADQQVVTDTSQVVFQTIHDYWVTLPEGSRPELYLFGLSLGSFGQEAVLGDVNMLNAPVDGALLAGPPFLNPLHTELTDNRDPGSPAWNPWYGEGRTVRFTAKDDLLKRDEGLWGPDTRLAYLQHGSDGVVWFSPTLLYRSPDWLADGQRAPDVSDRVQWVPVVTFWQVAFDLALAGAAPDGYGHMYAVRDYTQAWAGVFNIPGWTDEDTDAVATYVQQRHDEFNARIAALKTEAN